MASFTLQNNGGFFTPGTTVKAFRASIFAQAQLPPAGPPPAGAVEDASVVVAADGSIPVFNALVDGIAYYAYGQVGGVDRWLAFATQHAGATEGQTGPATDVIVFGRDPNNAARPLAVGADGSLTLGSQDAVGTTGVAVPAKAMYVGGIGADGFLHGILVDNSGQVQLASGGALAAAVPNRAVQVAGSDGTNLRALTVVPTGNSVGSTVPLLITGGVDVGGAAAQPLQVDSTGRTKVVGSSNPGSAVAGNPVLVGGSDGTNARYLSVDTTGQLKISDLTDPAALADSTANPTVSQIGAFTMLWDAANWQRAKSDTSGRQINVGASAIGAAVAGNPVLAGASDGTNARYIASDTTGKLYALPVLASGSQVAGASQFADGGTGVSTIPAALIGFNGTTFDRLRSTTTTGLDINVKGVNTQTPVTVGNGRLEVAIRPTTQDPVDSTGASAPVKFASISAASSGNNTIVAANASKKFRILGFVLIADAAVTAKFQSGAGGTDLTGAMSLIASSGVSFSGGMLCPAFETLATNTLLNLNLSGAVGVRGFVAYQEI